MNIDIIKADKKIRWAMEQIIKPTSLFSYFYLRQFTFMPTTAIPTMAVNNKKLTIIYNPNLVNTMPEQILAGYLMHELSHSILRHFERQGNRNPMLWNIATDGVINEDLLSKGWQLELPNTQIVKGEMFRNKSAEQVYAELEKQLQENGQQQLQQIQQGIYGYGQTIDDHNAGRIENDEQEKQENIEGEGKGKSEGEGKQQKQKTPNGSNGQTKEQKEETEEQGGKEGEEQGQGGIDKVNEAVKKAMIEVEEYAQKYDKEIRNFGLSGKEPDQVVKYVLGLTSVRFKFEDILKDEIYEALGDHQNWLFPHIASHSVGEYLPAMNDRKKKVVIVIDTSGSIPDWKAKEFVSLVNEILKRRNDVEGYIIQCDEAVLSAEKIKPNFKAKNMPIHRGTGGTSFRPPLEYVEKHRLNPKIMLYLTDGIGELPVKKPPYKLIWILRDSDKSPRVEDLKKFGKVIFYKGKEKDVI
jgi:predicted metal-dependent peptidase